MSKLLPTIFLGAFAISLLMLLAVSAEATTTATLSPAIINVIEGQTFNVAVSVNPQGIINYAEKIELVFSPSNLEVVGFTLGSVWMGLTQPGFDSIDNVKGIVIKTAGYPGGTSVVAPFGTITFLAKKAGTGSVQFGGNSVAFEAGGEKVMFGKNSNFVITPLPVKVWEDISEEIVSEKEVPSKLSVVVPVGTVATSAVASTSVFSNITSSSTQVAALEKAGIAGYGWLFGFIILAVFGWLFYTGKIKINS